MKGRVKFETIIDILNIPILKILFAPIFLLISIIVFLFVSMVMVAVFLLVGIYRLPQLLIGYWWCVTCGVKKWGVKEKESLREYSPSMFNGRYIYHTCCLECYKKYDGKYLK